MKDVEFDGAKAADSHVKSASQRANHATTPPRSLQSTIGNQSVQRLLAERNRPAADASVPAPTTVAAPDDPAERAAETVADGIASVPSRPETGSRATPPVTALGALGPGLPLKDSMVTRLEGQLGADLGRTRVHTDPAAHAAAASMDAAAFTVGNHIVFGRNQFAPDTSAGSRLLAHELTHVHQHAVDGRSGVLHRAPLPADSAESKVPAVISAGRRAVIQWGDDYATVANAEALRSGLRSGPNTAASGTVLHHNELTAESLAEMREVSVVIHGEPVLPDGARVRPGETVPRADVGIPGLPRGQRGPLENVTAEDMASRLVQAGFGKGRWTYYRVRLVMCFGGVGKAESFAARLAQALATRGVQAETMGALGRVTAVGTLPTEIVPRGEGQPRPQARPQPGVPQSELHYSEPGEPSWPLRRPGTGWQRNPPGTPPATPAAPVPKPAAPAPKPATPGGPTTAGGRRGGGGRLAIGAAKFFGPMILDAVIGYFVAKIENEKIAKAITAKLESAEVKERITELAEQQRLEAAYRRLRGESVFITVDLNLYLSNDLLNSVHLRRVSLTPIDETSSLTTVMSHEPIVGIENKTRYETTSFELDEIRVTEVERARLELRAYDARPSSSSAPPWKREALVAKLTAAEKREEDAKLAHIRSADIHTDPGQRARESADVADRLRRLPPPPAPEAAPAATPSPAPQQGPKLELSPAPAPSFTPLPGAPGEGPIERTARTMDSFEAFTKRLVSSGQSLEARIHGANSPTDAERKSFLTEETRWRLLAKYLQNTFKDQSRSEALDRLGRLVDANGGVLEGLRAHLGG